MIRKKKQKGGEVIPQVHTVVWVEEANKIRVQKRKRGKREREAKKCYSVTNENVKRWILLCPSGNAAQILY